MPGGRLFKNEKLVSGIKRKMMEELGVEVKVIKNLGFFEEFFESTEQDKNLDFHCISFVFLLHLKNEEISLDSQSSDWKWFSELPERLISYNLTI